jgi:hypothetical protein
MILLKLQHYQLQVVYKKGIEIHVAYFLSREAPPTTSYPQYRTNETVYALQAEFEDVNHANDQNISPQTLDSIKTNSAENKTFYLTRQVS